MAAIYALRGGNLVTLTAEGGADLPADLRERFENELQYVHKQFQEGVVSTQTVELFAYDDYDRFTCGAGFLPRLQNLAGQAFVEVPQGWPAGGDRFFLDASNLGDDLVLKDEQIECLSNLLVGDFGQVDAPPGFGKSFLFSAISRLLPNARIHIVASSIDVLRRIHNEIINYLPGVGMVGGAQCRFGRVTLVSASSLHKIDYEDFHSERFADIVLADEIHTLAAPKYLPYLARYRFARMYGFSATIGKRFDGADFALEGLFGPVVYRLSYEQSQAQGMVVPIEVEWIRMDLGFNPAEGVRDSRRARLGLWRNEMRNRRIADRILRIPGDEQVLVLVATVDHAAHLGALLPHFSLCYDKVDPRMYELYVDRGLIDEDVNPLMTRQRRIEMVQQFERGELRHVICTDVWSTGVSFNQLNWMVRADGRASEIKNIQAPGRVSRVCPETGKQCGYVLDCWDEFDERFLRATKKRYNTYEAEGWQQRLPSGVSVSRGGGRRRGRSEP